MQNLKAGTRISVTTREHRLCFVEYATQDELVCKVPESRLARLPSTMTIPRGQIREVRLLRSQAKDGWTGAAIGAGVGAAVGGGTGTGSRGARAFVGVLGGALIGSVVGTMVPIFQRGKIIYKR
jgi:outer membrane lipoprotein SlyB